MGNPPSANCPTILFLNNVSLDNSKLTSQLIASASHIICCDGGANQFHRFHMMHPKTILPTFIGGDLDSISRESKTFFQNKGIPFIHFADENANDFEKCVEQFLKMDSFMPKSTTKSRLITLNDFTRADHYLSLYQLQPELPLP